MSTPNRVKAFCIDFNWDLLSRFASPGLYAHAKAEEHLRWYQGLEVNTIQSFAVTHNGYAWYRSDVAPRTPGMEGDFLGELTTLGHRDGLRVMGYLSPGANGYWQVTRPELSHKSNWNQVHIPFTDAYLDYLETVIRELLDRVPIDGFMVDWLWSVNPIWMPCEVQLYRDLIGKFPGEESITQNEVDEFKRQAAARAWRRIHDVSKEVKPDCILWLSCNNLADPQLAESPILGEVDWIMNEHPDSGRLEGIGLQGQRIQCVCGWEGSVSHDASLLLGNSDESLGIYGFAKPDPDSTLPPSRGINGKNIETMRRYFSEH